MPIKNLANVLMPPAFRNDEDYKAGFVRVAIGIFMSFYLTTGIMLGYFTISIYGFTVLLISYIIYSIAVFIWILKKPGNIPRRYIVNFIDILFTTISSMIVGMSDSPFYLLYILIFIGQGGRFGRPYLYAAAIMSLISYVFLCFIDPNFSDHTLESSFKIFALIVLPLYLDSMLRTIQRAKKAADDANQSKSRFLATMSHEIRTPMSGAVGMINLLKTTELNNEQTLYVNGLSTSTSRLHMLINDILDFSKIEAGKLSLETKAYNLEDGLKEIDILLGSMAQQKGIKFSYSIADDIPKTLLGDPFRLCQILLNLAGNAIKFTEEGEVRIDISKRDSNLYFEVSDSGIGIEKKNLLHIFDGFTQADSSTTRKFGGTGLGTTIARELVKLMKGKIGANSEIGKGSTFWFEIPLQVSDTLELIEDNTSDNSNVPVTLANNSSLNILLAEDSEINILFMSTMLKKLGHNVDVVGNGRLAYQILCDNKYDIVFMDMHMPIMDGIEATIKWREEEAKRNAVSKIPIIALTANVSEDDRLRCLDAGMNQFLSKPVSPERLAEILATYCPTQDKTS